MSRPDLQRTLPTSMASGIERLERLFSKKKYAGTREPSAADRPSSVVYTPSRLPLRKGSFGPTSPSAVNSLQDVHFPQPSFIRPKAARMVPRDDHSQMQPRYATAARSQSVPEPPALPTRVPSLRGVAQARGGATRVPLGPPVAGAAHARSMSGATARGTLDSRRNSAVTDSTSATMSSGSSTISSSSNSSSGGGGGGSGSSYHGNYFGSHHNYAPAGTPAERAERAGGGAQTNAVATAKTQGGVPRTSSSLFQRRSVYVAPLNSFNSFQLRQSQRDSATARIHSGEISPSTVAHAHPFIASPSPNGTQHTPKIQGDDLTDLQDLQVLADLQALKDLHPLLFPKPLPSTRPPARPPRPDAYNEENRQSQETLEESASSSSAQEDDEATVTITSLSSLLTPSSSSKTINGAESKTTKALEVLEPKRKESAPTETPVLRRDSAFMPIVLPQRRSTSPPTTTRRKSRIIRRPMSLRYQRHLPLESAPSSPSLVLMEPNLGDFLSLSDDDIAEDVPAPSSAVVTAAVAAATTPTSPAKSVEKRAGQTKTMALSMRKPLPPAPSGSSTSPPVSPTSSTRKRGPLAASTPPSSQPPAFLAPPPSFLSLLPGMPLLSSPLSSTSSGRPRTPAGDARMAAAFEIARIASKYKFDLAYIATIWPTNMAFLQSNGLTAQSIGWPSTPTSPASAKPLMRANSSRSVRPSRASQASQASNGSLLSSASTAASTGTSRATATGSSSPIRQGISAPVGSSQSKLEAQFLAAYGLATVRAPYSLSAPTHAKILNAERWLEFSEPDAKPDEFARGYGCAFYRGYAPVSTSAVAKHYQRRPSADDCDADTEQDYNSSGRSTPRPVRRTNRAESSASTSTSTSTSTGSRIGANNRGIVFVAYRRKDVVDERAKSGEADDLEAVYRDVEALVDKILDGHMQQQRQAQLETERTASDVEATLAVGFSGIGASCTLRQSRFLGVKAAA